MTADPGPPANAGPITPRQAASDGAAFFDGGAKSPIFALRCISKSLRCNISTPHFSRFARLDLVLFSPPSQILTYWFICFGDSGVRAEDPQQAAVGFGTRGGSAQALTS
jgi:hypothetical protein